MNTVPLIKFPNNLSAIEIIGVISPIKFNGIITGIGLNIDKKCFHFELIRPVIWIIRKAKIDSEKVIAVYLVGESSANIPEIFDTNT